MRTRRLGATELEVPMIVFGAYAIGGVHWGARDDDAAIRAIHAAIEAGIRAFDMAPVYGLGHSEELLGRVLAGRRDDVVAMTKVGMR